MNFNYLFLLITLLSRVIPHPSNVTGMTAFLVWLCDSPSRKDAFIWMFITIWLTDSILVIQGAAPFGSWLWVTHSGYLLLLLFNSTIKMPVWLRLLSSTLIYWCWTNAGVWLCSGLYSHDLTGFLNCFTLALPFLRNAFAGDILYFAIFILISHFPKPTPESSKFQQT